VPIVCVGNLTAGGAGKTPTVLALLRLLAARACGQPCAQTLTRGYGGALAGPARVELGGHTAADVGDEALLLARAAPTWVARDRVAGARAAAACGARIIVMDDGFQNPALAKDLSLIVVDGDSGFGNGRVIPAGPLREPIDAGLARADAVVLIGEDRAGIAATVRRLQPQLPILAARIAPDADAAASLRHRRVMAFAGIGRPEKFFATLAACDAHVVAERAFGDHHRFTADDVASLEAEARQYDALLVTTEKDHVRLDAAAQARIRALPVTLTFDDEATVARLLDAVLVRDTVTP
jgi:tetraacyldisaccharide 4'-kinase